MPAASPSSRWLPRPQFSLRLLLLAFTAFAVGFPIWYRWPYEVLEAPHVGSMRITTWQRQWGGGRLKHGKHTLQTGKLMQSFTFQKGLLHGPYREQVGDQETCVGQYAQGKKEGAWIETAGRVRSVSNWHHGKLNGKCEFGDEGRGKTIAIFETGRLIAWNGQPVEDALFHLSQRKDIDKRTASELEKETAGDFVEMPLRDIVVYLQEVHNIPLVLDSEKVERVDLPITAVYSGINLGSALALLTAPNRLGCDYRYGCLWITTAKDAQDWNDATGVAEIKPPAGSDLARAWNEPVGVDAVNVPLANVLAGLVPRLAIEIDTTQIQPSAEQLNRFVLMHSIRGLPFHHILGQLLYKTGCRCRLDGETLVILPPESKAN